tara:strand:- start:2074 stop:2520 length:447 start_codon:yes stop_codon:yes gene_type:complete
MKNLSKEQWTSLLKSTKFFNIFDESELEKIINCSDLLRFPMYQYIIKAHEKDLSFYVVVKGHVNVISKTKSAEEQKLITINSGECFGEMSVITKGTRKNHIIAGSECYVVKTNVTTIDNFEMPIQLKIYKQFSVMLTKRLLLTGVSET